MQVIAADLDPITVEKAEKVCNDLSIPLINVRSYGFIGHIAISHDVSTIVEGKDLTIGKKDLRLQDPFPELKVCD